MRRVLPLSLALAIVTLACADRAPTAATPEFKVAQADGSAGSVTVMTQNLYVGADVDAVIGALASPSPDDDVPALLFAIETLGKTDYPARADAIADEIARARPHVVGLQEVSVIDIDLTALGLPIVVDLDFLAILRAKLAERGLHYDVAAQVQNIVAAPLPGISLVDHDAILVDADRVTVTSAGGRNFTFNVGVVAPGVELKRGWVFAHATIDGQPYTFVSTHTEADLAGAHLEELRAAQVSELVASLPTDRPVVVVGDLNDIPGSLMHQVLAGARFTDAWAALRPGAIGLTCCHRPDLSDEIAPFSQRIDYVFTRGLEGRGKVDRFGEVPADRLAGPAYPIWPSDHAGMIATLRR
ncbi:MAG TPA: endonuclease/exonuclease/phosphatase family protein [Gemmatimonadales bacterium]|jgi:endonuclease/exonuclease/phosphatase family metal-dependent hydrolase|nr:endonuclease/exonuclease/phosphatase family protein [Gemmatimonadales bacterium]